MMETENKKYPDYKDSHHQWIEEIPSHWETMLLNYLFEENRIKNKGDTEKNILSLSYGKIILKKGDGNYGLLPASFETYQILEPDYLVFRFTDLQNDQKSLRVGYVTQKGIITSAYVGLKKRNDNVCSKYYYYLFHSLDIKKYFYSFGGGVRLSLDYNTLKKVKFPLPPLAEQEKIVEFLNSKTTQIAHYIQLKEKTIALLEERKAAIINQAVTKGLDADVKMKDSGIEWLGEVPEGWEVKKLWYLISYITSGSRGWGNYYSEKGAVFIRVGNISKNKDISLNLEDLIFVSPPSSSEGKRTLIALNDVLLAITGATIGSVALIDKDLGEAYVNQHTALMRPIKEKINPKWLAYSLLSEYCQTQIRLKSYGGTKEGLGLNEVRTFKILLPPLWVQDSIIHEIDDKIHEINNHISCVSKEITLIKEYRESLISAAVTGKIDVREYQQTASEYAAADNY